MSKAVDIRRALALLVTCAALGAGVIPQGHAQSGTAAGAGKAAAGQQVFEAHCTMCHSIIPGTTLVGPSLSGVLKGPHPPKTVAEARMIILNGKGKMPSQKTVLTPKEIDEVLAYLKTL